MEANSWLHEPVVKLVHPLGRHGSLDIDTVMRQAENAGQRVVQLEAELLRVYWETEQRVEQMHAQLQHWPSQHRSGGGCGKGVPPPVVNAAARSAVWAKQHAEHAEAALQQERQRTAKLQSDVQRAQRRSEQLAAQMDAEAHHAHLLACANNKRIASVEGELESLQKRARASDERFARIETELERIQQCVVCMARARSVLIRPCGHMCMCDECAITLMDTSHKKCPCCRTGFYKKNLVFGIKLP